jgi:DNA polymerase-1
VLQAKKDIAVITDKDKAMSILNHVIDSGHLHALDFETTGLSPKDGAEVVLVSISGPAWTGVFDLWAMDVPLDAFKEQWEAVDWIVFYSGFEYRFFIEYGCEDVALHDVGYLRRAILGGGHFKLKDIALWDLKIEMSKELQNSDWGADELTEEQYQYAIDDAVVTIRLWEYWLAKATDDERRGYLLLNNMVPAVIEMEETGMALDTKYHQTLIDMWERRRDASVKYLRKMVTEDEVPNLNSNKQISNFLKTILDEQTVQALPQTEKTGDLKMKRETLTDLSQMVPYPLSRWLAALCVYNRSSKYLSSFGSSLLVFAESGSGRIHPRYNIGAARTGRFSSSAPNAQNMPKAPTFRKSIVSSLGRVLVGGDLSGIEVRVLAAMSGDDQLWHDQVYGDVHTQVASVAFNKPIEEVTKEERSKAKAITFMICYGGGASGLALRMKTDIDTAAGYIESWEGRYPVAMAFRNEQHTFAQRTGSLKTAGGRSMWVTKKASLPVCANYPIQGTALDVMAATIIELKDMLDDARERKLITPLTRLLSTVHDEIIIETTKMSAPIAEEMLQKAFEAGWSTIFPGTDIDNLYETGIGKNWSEIH